MSCRSKCKEFDETKVLSIQSHVVSGYAGNKSATFPLQVSRNGLKIYSMSPSNFKIISSWIITGLVMYFVQTYFGINENDNR